MTDIEQAVIAARVAGKSYRETARELGITRSRVGRIIKAHKDAPSLAEPETQTPAGPTPEPGSCIPGESGVSYSCPPDTGRDRPSSPTEQYASRFAGFISEVREVLESEPSKPIRQTVEGLLADLEARSQRDLKALAGRLARQDQERQARPDQERRALAVLEQRLAQAESKILEAEQAVQAAVTDGHRMSARRQLQYAQRQVADTQKAIAWRKGLLEQALEAAA